MSTFGRNGLNTPPVRAATLPGGGDPTGELGDPPDALADSEHTPAPPAGRAMQVEFIGTGAEYARLWYVNLILTVLSFGIYSAWAKVEQRRYLAAHTLIDGLPLVYEGKPFPILLGRLLAFGLVAIAWFASTLAPEAKPLIVVALILLAPWFLLSTLKFNARNHGWRGLPFAFTGHYGDAAKAVYPLLAWPITSLVFWGIGHSNASGLFIYLEVWLPLLIYALLWPRTMAAITCLKLCGLRYGTGRFVLNANAQDFNALYYRSGRRYLQVVWAAALIWVLAAPALGPEIGGALNTVAIVVLVAWGTGFGRARRFNFALHRLSFDNRLRFRSTLSLQAHSRLFLRNAALTLATLGLAAPWCLIKVRQARAEAVTVYVEGSLDEITANQGHSANSLGESISEGLGLDFSL